MRWVMIYEMRSRAFVVSLASAGRRDSAARALGVIGALDDTVVPALQNALMESDDTVVFYVIRALGLIGPDARDAVPDLLEYYTKSASSGDRSRQSQIVEVLGKIGDRRAIAVLSVGWQEPQRGAAGVALALHRILYPADA